jgi:S1-C subfamily serine protease
MKRVIALLTVLSIVVVALPALAGHGKCTASTQECLDKYAAKMGKTGWAGFEGEYDEESGIFTLTAVTPDSPAEKAGFMPGDKLHAWNGIEFASMSEDDWTKSAKERTPGDVAEYTLTRHGKEKTISVTLAKMPEEMVAKKIGTHMLTHAQVASNDVQ